MTKKTGSFCLSMILVSIFFLASITFAQQGGGGAPAGGAQGGGTNPDIVGQWDKDKDGKVSKAEWPRSEKLFKEYDKNNNGYIDSDEKPQMPTDELMDANGDGKVSKDEFVGPAEFFKQLDKNGDGYLTADENTMKSDAGAGSPGAGGAKKN
jgi:hypothetical protein